MRVDDKDIPKSSPLHHVKEQAFTKRQKRQQNRIFQVRIYLPSTGPRPARCPEGVLRPCRMDRPRPKSVRALRGILRPCRIARPRAKSVRALRGILRPCRKMVGQGRLELPTSRLSSARSNQLSYRPKHNDQEHLQPRPASRRTEVLARPTARK